MLTFQERRTRALPSGLRITTVDNYQGEENKIILLSLVRSNAKGHIGFLKTENRVCVALSRARDGLFIIGNMENLTRSSSIWPQIEARLEQTRSIGNGVLLVFLFFVQESDDTVMMSVDLLKLLILKIIPILTFSALGKWLVGLLGNLALFNIALTSTQNCYFMLTDNNK